ncbi:MAG: phenylalanine--tRNA ligase subunit beta, partial [Janthinobacterium lividum]
MKFTLSWLKEFLDTSASLSEITAALDGIGLEVAETIDRSVGLEQFEVAHIAKTISHPVAEKLKICEVETKKGILQIVCGAKNARSGLKVVLAPIGSLIPNGNFKIKESEIRTVKSYGMLCSGEELNINKDSEGIIELPDDAVIGEQILKYLSLDDPIICIEITPNRADALGVYGIARDLAARGIGNLKEIKVNEIKGTFKSDFFVDIQEKEYCSIFATRELKNLTNKQSPIWLKKKLEDIKISSISAIVDITNYICYSFGQPMHAYDRSRLGSGMEVKFAGKNSNFKALNNKDYILSTQDLIITDEKIPQSIAGIIGSLHSACSEANDETINIILEAACFSPDIIMEAGRRHNILTDSRYRFERNVDSASTLKFLDIATNMILSICGGETSELIVKGNGERIPKIVELPLDFVSNYTGLEIP